MESGSWAEWFAALGGLCAVAAAVAAGYYAKAAHSLERDRENRAEESRRRSQASRIAAWPSFRTEDGRYGVMIANTSDSLVYGLEVVATSEARGDGRIDLRFLPPGHYFVDPWHREDRFPDRIADESDYRPVMSTDKYAVMLTFTDAKGVHWSRRPQQPLDELPARA
ncbi:hypothetical protein F9L07_20750 [Pimelobacter simplex]|uniref:Uncharacterized protein n=1 Tax=Nocardioides simplex TaxID=2045 RepID=A0A7J5DVW5_NOCSI|nr:hypothetical protein [Pimelobacter simplex]KAB2809457.1 hypothetical protein F9L07_20750 [Pimelobacter simplex]